MYFMYSIPVLPIPICLSIKVYYAAKQIYIWLSKLYSNNVSTVLQQKINELKCIQNSLGIYTSKCIWKECG